MKFQRDSEAAGRLPYRGLHRELRVPLWLLASRFTITLSPNRPIGRSEAHLVSLRPHLATHKAL